MDSLTQLALGGAVGTAVLGHRVGRRAAVWGAICGTLPDLDSLYPHAGPVAEFTYHRGFSHSALLLTALTPLLVWLIVRIHADTRSHWRSWTALVWLALITHALLDCFTIYGTQLLLPLDPMPVGWGTIFIIDPLFTLPLLIGLGAFLLRGGTRARRSNAWALAIACGYLLFTVGAKLHVQSRAQQALTRQQIDHSQVLSVPTPFNSLLWRIVVIADDVYYEGFYSLFDEPGVLQLTAQPRHRELLEPLADHWPVERLVWFTRGYYAARWQECEVVLVDLRMGQEPYYFFPFVVGRQQEGEIVPVRDRRLGVRGDAGPMLRWLARRIWQPLPAPEVDGSSPACPEPESGGGRRSFARPPGGLQ